MTTYHALIRKSEINVAATMGWQRPVEGCGLRGVVVLQVPEGSVR
jgi:hypothetical protein